MLALHLPPCLSTCCLSYHAACCTASGICQFAHHAARQLSCHLFMPSLPVVAVAAVLRSHANCAATTSMLHASMQSSIALNCAHAALQRLLLQRLRELQAETPDKPVMLRVEVEGGGCSGFQYKFKLDDSRAQAEDL